MNRCLLARAFGVVLAGWGVLALGCMRSGSLPTLEIDCGEGERVLIEGSALCVWVGEPPESCPVGLPHRFEREGGTVCTRQARPAAGLVEQAIARVLAGDAGVVPVDAGVQPIDGGVRFVDMGGATGGDF